VKVIEAFASAADPGVVGRVAAAAVHDELAAAALLARSAELDGVEIRPLLEAVDGAQRLDWATRAGQIPADVADLFDPWRVGFAVVERLRRGEPAPSAFWEFAFGADGVGVADADLVELVLAWAATNQGHLVTPSDAQSIAAARVVALHRGGASGLGAFSLVEVLAADPGDMAAWWRLVDEVWDVRSDDGPQELLSENRRLLRRVADAATHVMATRFQEPEWAEVMSELCVRLFDRAFGRPYAMGVALSAAECGWRLRFASEVPESMLWVDGTERRTGDLWRAAATEPERLLAELCELERAELLAHPSFTGAHFETLEAFAGRACAQPGVAVEALEAVLAAGYGQPVEDRFARSGDLPPPRIAAQLAARSSDVRWVAHLDAAGATVAAPFAARYARPSCDLLVELCTRAGCDDAFDEVPVRSIGFGSAEFRRRAAARAAQLIGDDPASWRLFAELSDFNGTLGELCSMVSVAQR
jgi:hypothetical protein